MQHRPVRLIGEAYAVEPDFAANRRQSDDAPRVGIFGAFAQHFASPVQPGDRLGELCADAHHLEDRRHEKREEQGERDEAAEREFPRDDLPGAQEHHDRAHDTHQQRGR